MHKLYVTTYYTITTTTSTAWFYDNEILFCIWQTLLTLMIFILTSATKETTSILVHILYVNDKYSMLCSKSQIIHTMQYPCYIYIFQFYPSKNHEVYLDGTLWCCHPSPTALNVKTPEMM